MSYTRFFAMIATSTIVMFGLMYLNTYLITHVFWSETRAYMAIVMGATMAVIMLGFMLSMYPSRAMNLAIFLGSIVVFSGALWLVRSQAVIGDQSYMRAMIPHHSIAIMTSSRADISDPRVRKLADEIIYAQDKEIAEMRYLIADIERSGDATTDEPSEPAEIVSLEEALSSAKIAPLDPEFITEEEVRKLFPEGSACTFAYTTDSEPVLAFGEVGGAAAALVKLSGDLIRLSAEETADGRVFATDGLILRLDAPAGAGLPLARGGDPMEAELTLDLERGLEAGYIGYAGCRA